MAEQFAVTQIPGAETGEIPPSPVDRDEKTAFIYSLVDPIWDIDTPAADLHQLSLVSVLLPGRREAASSRPSRLS